MVRSNAIGSPEWTDMGVWMMKKRSLALTLLAAVTVCSALVLPALAAETPISCDIRPDGGVEVTIPAATFSGGGVAQVATYSAQGRFMDFKSVAVDDLAQGYRGILSARTESGGTCKAFLLGGEGYQPLTENFQAETKGPAKLLATVTKGAKFTSSSSIWNDRADSYVGVDCETDEDGYVAPGKVTYYLNGRSIGARAVDAQPGDVARIYDTDGNGKADAVMIAQYHVTQLTGNASTEGDRVSIPGVTGGFVPADWIDGPSAGLKKGDIILWCFEDGAEPSYTIETVTDMTKITQSDPDKGVTVGALKSIGMGVVVCDDGGEGRSFQYDEETFCVVIDLKVDPATGKTVYYDSGAFDPENIDLDPEVYETAPELYVLADKQDTDCANYIYVVRTLKAD